MTRRAQTDVILNIYDLNENNKFCYQFGLGFYHSGVEINGEEWTFSGGSGIFSHSPKSPPGEEGIQLRETVKLGEFGGTFRDVEKILDDLRPRFRGSDYHLMTKNCNCFAEAFVKLLIQKELPGYVNRLAVLGGYFSCLLPPSLAPPNNGQIQNQPSINVPFAGKGNKLGGDESQAKDESSISLIQKSQDERREVMRQAALARFGQSANK